MLDNGAAFNGIIEIEVDFYYNIGATSDGFVGTSQAGGASASANAFGAFNAYAGVNPEANALFARNQAVNANVDLTTTLSAETWYTLKLVIDSVNQTYDVLLDGSLLADDFTFRSVNPVQELFLMVQTRLSTIDQTQGVYFDNYTATQALSDPDAPVIVIALSGGSDIDVSFQSINGVNYLLEYSEDGMATWNSTGVSGTGDGNTLTLTDTGATPIAGSAVFYRVVASN